MSEASPAQAFWNRLAEVPEGQDFLVTPDRRRTYGDLRNGICRYCGLFDLAEATPGQMVVAVTDDDWTIAQLFLAALLDGLVPIVLSPDAGEGRIAGILRHTSPVLVFADTALTPALWAQGAVLVGPREAAAAAAEDELGQTALSEVLAISEPRDPRAQASADDLAYLLFTSGTTGTPKGAMLSHRTLATQLEDLARVLHLGPDARLGNALVPFHTDGLIQGPVLTAWAGATLLRPPRFEVGRIDDDLAFLAGEDVTHVISVPTVFDMLDRYARSGFGGRLKILVSTAAPLHPELWDRLEARFGATVVNEYGMTETVAASHFAGALPEMGKRYSIGKPVGCTASLRASDGAEVPTGETGELWLRGGCIFQGYFNAPELTQERLVGGWLRTGDLARREPDGSYHIVGRVGTAINAGGFLILPEEIDEAILRAPGVADAKTVGVPHPDYGEIPVAVVAGEGLAADALSAHCRAHLDGWKQPRRYVFVPRIPRTASGKADIAAVRALAEADTPAAPADSAAEDGVLALIEDLFHMAPGTATPGLTPDDIPGWDSYAHTALVLELEDRFDITLGATEVQGLGSIADILVTVAAKTAAKA